MGRTMAIGPHDAALRCHRAWMSTDAAKEAYRRRKQLVEPVFGIIKETDGSPGDFLLRGLVNVGGGMGPHWPQLSIFAPFGGCSSLVPSFPRRKGTAAALGFPETVSM